MSEFFSSFMPGKTRPREAQRRRRTRSVSLLAPAVAAVAAFLIPVGSAAAQGQSGTTLSATKTATTHYTKTFEWTIDKSVAPDHWQLFKGDSGTSKYTISVTKDEGTVAASVSGRICVTNGGAVATQGLAIADELQINPSTPVTTQSVDVSANPVLDPGETGCYDYEIALTPDQTTPGATYKNTAHVTITNHSGHLGTPFGPDPSDTSVMAASPTPVNASINVDDSNGGSWPFSDDGAVDYNEAFDCDADEGTHNNTATIRETLQSDDASVEVECYSPSVTKDAKTALDRTYGWSIDKSADKSSLTLAPGQTSSVNYTVVVTNTGSADSNWGVSGKITVSNPAPIGATITGVKDEISGVASPATVDCGVTFPYTIEAGKTLECTYSSALPNAAGRTNTATATLQNYAYDSGGIATEDGTTDFAGTAAVDFANATVNEIDECVSVSDSLQGSLGTVCKADSPKTINYTRSVGPYATCGNYTVDNTASFTTNDKGATGSDSHSVAVNVPCAGGCTLTQGYWKTHSLRGPASYDDAWLLVGPNGADTLFFGTGQSWYQVFWTPPAGNPYYNLAHQYEAARLNQLNGASVPATVQGALSSAATLLANAPGTSWTKAQKTSMLSAAGTLAAYNEGSTGPGHCSEDGSSSSGA